MALATIVAVRGSTYRREGARFVVPAVGLPVGTISGGCLEGDVRLVAEEVMADGRPRLIRYDLTADDEAVWGWGLGCNGLVDVFVEPADRAGEIAAAMRGAIHEQRAVAVVTVVEADAASRAVPGARLLVRPEGMTEGSLGDQRLDERAAAGGLRSLSEERSGLVELGPGVRAFVEALVPPPRVVVCGAGHDAIPLVAAAAKLGFRVEVVDDREAFLTQDRFTGAARLVHTDPPQAADSVAVDHRTNVVVMSHNFVRDKGYLRSFLGSPARYIGMLGPAARFERLLEHLRREGLETATGDLRRVHSPAGLDVGAEDPEEIALAIVGEIMAVQDGRGGGFLKDRSGPIHERGSTSGTESVAASAEVPSTAR
jgi:xanthine dehydrogenase accessory factor